MNCESFEKLSVKEKIILQGQLSHIAATSEESFQSLQKLIRQEQEYGCLQGVTFLPYEIPEQPIPNRY